MEIINRIKADLIIWQEREKEYAALPGADTQDKRFQKEKLAYLDGIAVKYRDNLGPDERLAMITVNGMRERIEKNSLNFFERTYRKLTAGKREKVIAERQAVFSSRQTDRLTATINQLGFHSLRAEVIRKAELGQPSFTIPVSVHKSATERMDYVLQFERDRQGQYQLEHFRAKLHNGSQSISPELTFKQVNGQHFTATQAYNLLAGKSVGHQYMDPVNPNQAKTIWYKLDRSSGAEPRLKEFWPDQGFIAEVTLSRLPLRNKEQDLMTTVYPQLLQGHRVGVEVAYQHGWRTIFLEADPQNNGFKFYNDYQSPITKWDALQIKDPATTLPPVGKAVSNEMDRKFKNQVHVSEPALSDRKPKPETKLQPAVKTKSSRKKTANRMRKR